jgi:HTH-type transcriptional regulator / antitoxin HipB
MERTMPDVDSALSIAIALGEQIRDRRRRLDLSQEQLAELAGVSLRFVGTLERGKATVRLSAVLAVCEALGLKVTLS